MSIFYKFQQQQQQQNGSMKLPVTYSEVYEHRREYIKQRINQLHKYYPVNYALLHSISLIILGIAALAIQLVMIVKHSELCLYATGIFVALSLFTCATFALLLVKHRSVKLFTASIFLHMIAFCVSIGGLVVVNTISLARITIKCENQTDDCNKINRLAVNLHIIMFIISGMSSILCIVYFLSITCCIYNRHKNTNNQANIDNNNNNNNCHKLNRFHLYRNSQLSGIGQINQTQN